MTPAPPPSSPPLLSLLHPSKTTLPSSSLPLLPPEPPNAPPLEIFNSPLSPPPPRRDISLHSSPLQDNFHPSVHPNSSLDLTYCAPSLSSSVFSTTDENTPIHRLAIANILRSSSHGSTSLSPSRPCRVGTGLPQTAPHTITSECGIEMVSEWSARDEFEEDFLNRRDFHKEDMIINRHLDEVDFRQLEDDEEVLSDDAAHPSQGDTAARRANDALSQGVDNVEPRPESQSTIQSYWKRIPTEVGCEGCEGCEGCARLCGENRRLRRQLDELEFELASGVLHNPADGFDPPQVIRAPTISQVPATMRKTKGWAARFRNLNSANISSSKSSEKARLKSEVQALNVTTEYLWRKLNKAEIELRNYRLRDLRRRIK